MKSRLKFIGMVAMVALIGFSMTGCPTIKDNGGTPAVTIFDLAQDARFQNLALGETRIAQIFDSPYKSPAGTWYTAIAFEIVQDEGRNLLQVTAHTYWAGVDLMQSGFNFQAGDVIRVVGRALTDNRMQLLTPGTWVYFGQRNVSVGQAFEFEHTLTAENVTNAIEHSLGNHPNGIRISGNSAGATFIITEITVSRG